MRGMGGRLAKIGADSETNTVFEIRATFSTDLNIVDPTCKNAFRGQNRSPIAHHPKSFTDRSPIVHRFCSSSFTDRSPIVHRPKIKEHRSPIVHRSFTENRSPIVHRNFRRSLKVHQIAQFLFYFCCHVIGYVKLNATVPDASKSIITSF